MRLSLSDRYGKKYPEMLNDIERDLVTLQRLCRESGKKKSFEEFERNHQNPIERWVPCKRWSFLEGKVTPDLFRKICEAHRRSYRPKEREE